MNRFTLLCLLLISSVAHADGVYYLKSDGSNSGVVACDGQQHTGHWTNNTGGPIIEVLYQTRLQPYINGGDTVAELVIYVEQPGGDKHWIGGAGSHGETENVAITPPGGYRVEAGGRVWISVWCWTTGAGSALFGNVPMVQGIGYVHYRTAQ